MESKVCMSCQLDLSMLLGRALDKLDEETLG
jgi:hypothetical protein